jgi:hypothetical protein
MAARNDSNLYDTYRSDPRFPDAAAVADYMDRVPLTAKEHGFYRRLLTAFENAERKTSFEVTVMVEGRPDFVVAVEAHSIAGSLSQAMFRYTDVHSLQGEMVEYLVDGVYTFAGGEQR